MGEIRLDRLYRDYRNTTRRDGAQQRMSTGSSGENQCVRPRDRYRWSLGQISVQQTKSSLQYEQQGEDPEWFVPKTPKRRPHVAESREDRNFFIRVCRGHSGRT